MTADKWIYRDAKLMETGVYADKGVQIREEDLQRMAQGFKAPVPVLVEHQQSPIMLGWLREIWRKGSELFGKLALLPEADALLQRLRVRGLSLAVSSDLSHILEVSVTGNPRVASAQLFSGYLSHLQEVLRMETVEIIEPEFNETELMQQRIQHLENALKEQSIQTQIQRWLQSGKLSPASASFAKAMLLETDSSVQFNHQPVPVAVLFAQFVDSLPAQPLLSETAPQREEPAVPFSHEEQAFLQQAFPDLALDHIAQYRETAQARR
ncbi:MAG: hypothetical protein KIT45_09455 [Fimbriimonadia bacterium]|nr:hypothetical protein [Fimbriimonadia bacterium]